MPDYMFLLESRLSPEQHAVLMRVQELAQAAGMNLYLTGGAVRDLISGMPIRDLDFTIEGSPFGIVEELEKGGAVVVERNERLRHVELIFTGDVDGSIAAARDEFYSLPGTKAENRWSTVMEDLRRRDFSVNAIAISLNPASRGLLLDPTNGLADLERREMRSLSIHGFTNQPGRLLRIVRYATRLGFKMESRTGDWFDLALERDLHRNIPPEEVGRELRQLGREENPGAILRAWEARDLISAIHPSLARRRPDYEGLTRLSKVSANMVAAGVRPRLFAPVTHYLLRRLKAREASATLRRLELRAAEIAAVAGLETEAAKVVKVLKSRKLNQPREAYSYIDKVPRELLAFIQVEYSQGKVLGKIRNYISKWRPLRLNLPAAELDALGVPRGPKFNQILEDFFTLQLRGRGRTPPDRTRILRQLAGIKPEVKKPPKKKGKKDAPGKKATERAAAEPAAASPTAQAHAAAAGAGRAATKEKLLASTKRGAAASAAPAKPALSAKKAGASAKPAKKPPVRSARTKKK